MSLGMVVILASCSGHKENPVKESNEVSGLEMFAEMEKMAAERGSTPEDAKLKEDITLFLQSVSVDQDTKEVSLKLTEAEALEKGMSKENYDMILASFKQAISDTPGIKLKVQN